MFAKNMSETEKLFVNTYVQSLNRDQELVRVVIYLMDPEQLNVSDVVVATQVAFDVLVQHAQFEQQLVALDAKHQFVKKTPAGSWPPTKEFETFFTWSFFTVDPNSAASDFYKKWYSGSPTDWLTILKASALDAAAVDFLNDPNSQILNPNLFTGLTKAAKKLFGKPGQFFFDLLDQFKTPLNTWPVPDAYDEQLDDYDDYDEDDDYE